MRQPLFVLLLFVLTASVTTAQTPYWQQKADFVIDVTLNDIEHTLDGFEKITYTNQSPDTLHFIWFHLWPNAYKNDKTAFSEQLLVNNRTDFYFSTKEQRGYINSLDFKINGATARTEDHPEYIDIVKVLLPQPLPPGAQILIATPFHVKLPYLFSRSGHVGQSYQIAQWYPKPAVYDKKGWHPIPYLDQGEFYSEFGSFDVRITVPKKYIVAATGELQDESEKQWLKELAAHPPVDKVEKAVPVKKSVSKKPAPKKPVKKNTSKSQKSKGKSQKSKTEIPEAKVQSQPETKSLSGAKPDQTTETKTIQFKQDNIHDFAWFADKNFTVAHDSLQLPSGKIIDVFSYYKIKKDVWKKSIQMSKDALRFRSNLMGEYPYNIASVVQGPEGDGGGMEYPTITLIRGTNTDKELDFTIEHELGHNWLYGILGSNEREHPWMDEGMNTYYDDRYLRWKYQDSSFNLLGDGQNDKGIEKKLPKDIPSWLVQSLASIKKDQPMDLPSAKYTELNYGVIVYLKTAQWMKALEDQTGKAAFDKNMQAYYQQWQFKHPYPEDFRQVMDTPGDTTMNVLFEKLHETGTVEPIGKRQIKLAPFFDLRDTKRYSYIFVGPSVGYNMYDGFMVGGLIHNYQLPFNRFQFLAAPMYATGSKTFSGLARASYSWYPSSSLYKVELGAAAAKFSADEYQPEGREKLYFGFRKVAPFVRVTLNQKDPLSKLERFVQFKSYFISEDNLEFKQVINGNDTTDVANKVSSSTNINQLKFVIRNTRILYPYSGELLLEQSKDFIRTAFTGNYYFNYSNRQGGLNVRLFAGKFFYTASKTISKQFETDRYHLNLSGPDGYEDYTYSNYFIGRNKYDGFASQQMMMRDGGFKVRTELLSDKVGKTDRWLLATNLTTDIPKKINPLEILPIKIPLKIFADIGTNAEGWDKNSEASRFLYDAGFQLSLMKGTVNIYIPVIYSKVYKDYFKSTLGDKWFWKTITFSIDIQNFSLKKLSPEVPF